MTTFAFAIAVLVNLYILYYVFTYINENTNWFKYKREYEESKAIHRFELYSLNELRAIACFKLVLFIFFSIAFILLTPVSTMLYAVGYGIWKFTEYNDI